MPDTLPYGQPVTLAYKAGGCKPRLYVHSRPETISNILRNNRVWQHQVTAFVLDYLRKGDVFVDVGANLGYFSVYAALKVGPAGQVHAVEPADENLALLRANLALNDLANVIIHPIAVADVAGERQFFSHRFNSGAHSLVEKDDLTPGNRVAVTTLDALLAQERAPRLIKIDVQGAEVDVLHGMISLLKNSQSKPAIIVEFAPADIAKREQLDAFFAFVKSQGYMIRAFIGNIGASLTPPQLRRATLRQIADDLVQGNDFSELDIALLPIEGR